MADTSTQATAPDSSLTRTVQAPRERVWAALTRPEHVRRWWAPEDFTTTVFDMDVRPGGTARLMLQHPDGIDEQHTVHYGTVTPPQQLAYTVHSGDQADADFTTRVSLEDASAQTRVRVEVLSTTAERPGSPVAAGTIDGVDQRLCRLDRYVSATPEAEEFVISQTFDAPLAQVWQAWSQPERFARWWGPKGSSVKLQKMEMEFAEGGVLLYSMLFPAMPEMWGKFVFGPIQPLRSIEYVNSFSNAEGNTTRAPFPGMEDWPLEVLNRLSFAAEDGQTTVTLRGGPINARPAERAMFAGFFDSLRHGFSGTFEQLKLHLAEDRASSP